MQQSEFEAAGLAALLVGSPLDANTIVVLLHGYSMRPEDLEPFAHSMRETVLFCFPRAPRPASNHGFAWWPIDDARREKQIAAGPRDLATESPPGLPDLRSQLGSFLSALRQLNPSLPLVLGGFSQGGMLACDYVLHEPSGIRGLVLLSSSRISHAEWFLKQGALRGLPVLISHGRNDPDLAFSAGEALRDFHVEGGAKVTWVSFNGGHEIPLNVWRSLRTFLRNLF